MTQLGSIFEPEGEGPRGRDLHAEATVPAWALGLPGGYEVQVPLELAATGGYTRRVVVDHEAGAGVRLCLPEDFPDGGTLRLRGQGEPRADGRPGDLLLRVHVDARQADPPPEIRALLAAIAEARPPAPARQAAVARTGIDGAAGTWLIVVLAAIAALMLLV